MNDARLDMTSDCLVSPRPYECDLTAQGPACVMPDGRDGRIEPSPCAPPFQSDYSVSDEATIEHLLWHMADLPLDDRLECAAVRLLGTPYLVDPLGEGPFDEIDSDPLYSLTALDCMTYVEEVMALSSGAVGFDEFLGSLSQIRYLGGAELYGMRRHFVSVDWLPENEAAGRMRDITWELAGREVEYATMTIDRVAWMGAKEIGEPQKSRTIEDLRHIGKGEPELAVMEYIPLSALYQKVGDEIYPNEALLDMLPDISIALLVRPQGYVERYGTIVAHMGFLVFEHCEDGSRGELLLRHASSKSGEITEEPFFPYIDSQSKYRAGIAVLEILDPLN